MQIMLSEIEPDFSEREFVGWDPSRFESKYSLLCEILASSNFVRSGEARTPPKKMGV